MSPLDWGCRLTYNTIRVCWCPAGRSDEVSQSPPGLPCRHVCRTMCVCWCPATRRTWRFYGALCWLRTMPSCPTGASAPSTCAMTERTPRSGSGERGSWALPWGWLLGSAFLTADGKLLPGVRAVQEGLDRVSHDVSFLTGGISIYHDGSSRERSAAACMRLLPRQGDWPQTMGKGQGVALG